MKSSLRIMIISQRGRSKVQPELAAGSSEIVGFKVLGTYGSRPMPNVPKTST